MSRISRVESRGLTRERLRGAGLREFATRGFGGASTDRIAEAAGFSRGAFYSNYVDKQALFLELARELLAHESAQWQQVLDQDRDIEDMLAFFEGHGERFAASQDWGLLIVELALHAQRDATFAVEYRRYSDEVTALAARQFEQIFRKSGKRVPADIAALSRSLVIFAVSLLIFDDGGGRANNAHYAASTFMSFLRGLIAQAPDRKNAAKAKSRIVAKATSKTAKTSPKRSRSN